MLASLVALSLWPWSNPTGIEESRFRVHGWTAERRTDAVTGEVRCRLTRGRLHHEGRLLTLDLRSPEAAANGVVRVDTGAPMLLADLRFEAVGLGAQFGHEPVVSRPSRKAYVPDRIVSGAGAMTVRARSGGRIERFSLSGLDDALTAAAARGCAQSPPALDRVRPFTNEAAAPGAQPGSKGAS